MESRRELARTLLSAAARETSEYARSLVSTIGDQHAHPGETVRMARQLQVLAKRVRDMAAMVELASGLSWAHVAMALGRGDDEDDVRAEYESMWEAIQSGVQPPWPGLPGAANLAPLTTDAAALDAWYTNSTRAEVPADAVTANLF